MFKNLAIVVGLVADVSAFIPYGYNGYDSTGYGYNELPTLDPATTHLSTRRIAGHLSPTEPATMDTATDVIGIRRSGR